MNNIRKSYIKNCIANNDLDKISKEDLQFIIEETNSNKEFVIHRLKELGKEVEQ